ncbi:dienelactone hydrolase family protein [Loktanella sp. SALINAS62]|uniref:alpha/beta hydrolase n=1 Tax=Loktanella sp. SALINAS62 TaxID=2706124 RepID=UPI001B8D0F4D|nr:dienelactone hydrolase family protein [Loktanella sp. SALINAS62]MBS1302750.1 phospholipase [Loktanella sp. SALINAS62]
MGNPIHVGATSDDANVICIVVHGRGQTQGDMLAMIVDRLDLPDVRFALPKSVSEAWYAARAIDPLGDRTPAELDHGIAQIAAVIAAERANAPGRPVLLCGFSQGACMAVELLMRRPDLADAACLLTGCRVGVESDDLPFARLDGVPVYASCGDDDPWIPAGDHHKMLATLTRAGARLRADMFPGRPHAVNDTEIAVLSGMLIDLALGHVPMAGDT